MLLMQIIVDSLWEDIQQTLVKKYVLIITPWNQRTTSGRVLLEPHSIIW